MNNTYKKYLFFLLFAFILIAFLDYNKPKNINWNNTYAIRDKIPFGLYILNKEMPAFVKKQNLTKYNKTPYEFLTDSLVNNDSNKTILIIGSGSEEYYYKIELILDFVARGNNFFMIAEDLPWVIMDTLNIDTSNEFYDLDYNKKNTVWTNNNNLFSYRFDLNKAFNPVYFNKIDSLKTTVLGFQQTEKNGTNPNFIKIPYGKGVFYLNTQPKAFTNYSLLESNNHLYAENVLSYLDDKPVYWFVKDDLDEAVISTSPLRFILQNSPLKWAWYFLLLGFIGYIIFTAKRKQRIIPVKDPVKNTTVEFTKTISNLYLLSNNYPDLMDKIILYSLEKIRRVYLIDTHKLNEEFVDRLHKMTNKDKGKIEDFVKLIKRHQASPESSTQESVIALNALTEEILN